MNMSTLPAFTKTEYEVARKLLSARVATMMGRKMEEGDWDFVYTNAKKIPSSNWSNLHIDVIHDGLGVEHKMMRFIRNSSIKQVCGTSLMHPSATRSIRIPDINADPNEVAKDVLTQYGELIQSREKMVEEQSQSDITDMRFGWLIWKELLDEFLYFEEPMVPPDPSIYYAEWNENPARGARKATKNLWIYEKKTGKKRYSVTTTAGAKIQPYFDVPPPTDPNLYYFKVQGLEVGDNLVEVWVTKTTAKYLESILGGLDTKTISEAILKFNPFKETKKEDEIVFAQPTDIAVPIVVSKNAYRKLTSIFEFISDEYVMQQFALQVN